MSRHIQPKTLTYSAVCSEFLLTKFKFFVVHVH